MRALFASRNVVSLQQLNGGDILLDVCVELVYLKRYLAYYQDCVRGGDYVMPTSMSEAMSTRTRWVRNFLKFLLNDNNSCKCDRKLCMLCNHNRAWNH